METLLTALRAAAEPTRLRLLALLGRGAFCVTELCEVLGQSQPRLSRHLRLMTEAGLIERAREGTNAWYTLPLGAQGELPRSLVNRLPQADPVLAADARQAARVLAERARAASDSFRRQGADWDEMRALGLPAHEVEQALLALLPEGNLGRLIDIGTGTGNLLELLAPRISTGIGIDASKAMLALARARLAKPGLEHFSARQGDMYRLPVANATHDIAVLQMVLHYAEDPEGAIREAARVLRPGGLLAVIDLAQHDNREIMARFAHRWPGFSTEALRQMLAPAGMAAPRGVTIDAKLPIAIWISQREEALTPAAHAEPAYEESL